MYWEQWAYLQRWILAWDMNRDGAITISDIVSIFWYLFYAPGDGLIYFCSKFQEVATFLEISPLSYYSGWSLTVSVSFWFIMATGVIVANNDL